ncbi:hypothetical protein M2360_002873 [Rhizobium sp. SG_E_25_P2]|uniref:D-apionate lactonase n=1 Tax=Rhizobium sp. SG_E_25_P2 TaxID=2879942 RepID=UPI002474CCA5|nr:hypothetical protein [Rhizobium sp. SG_E_25_P2]MDH6267476.1 hypothetical protein [Rhizobium sp. SG_E_25_P2]
MSSLDFRLYGTYEPPAPMRRLTAGPLSVDLQDGNLRTIRYRGHEVLRAIAFLVRDKDWGTCAAKISDLAIHESEPRFRITYRASYSAPDGAGLFADIVIEGEAERIRFTANFTAQGDFETARAGFTVLHPIVGVSGQPVTVGHADGSVEQAHWPRAIDPWQPFKEIASITHRVASGITAETRFAGDIFEMEDQRNWTDGSYKTYVRPLALPWPYRLESGARHSQSVELILSADAAAPALARSDAPIALALSPKAVRLPEIGVGLRPDCAEAEARHLPLLEQIGARHLIAHFDPIAGHGLDALKHYAYVARQTGLKLTLECAVACKRPLDDEMAELAALIAKANLPIDTLFVSPSVDRQSTPPGSAWPNCPPLEDLYQAARKAFPGVRLGGGMLSYFTELNRKRIPGHSVDYVSHCTNPIVHAADDLSVMQSFEALADVVASARALYDDKPYRIGPSTITMRQNPYGSATKDNPTLSRIPMANVDPRHNGLFGAAFALAYAATTLPAGLELLTLSSLAGPFGLIAGEGEPCAAGTLRPLGRIITELAALSGKTAWTLTSETPSEIVGLAAEGEGRTVLLAANITSQRRIVRLPSTASSLALLAADDLEQGFKPGPTSDIVSLPAYACLKALI